MKFTQQQIEFLTSRGCSVRKDGVYDPSGNGPAPEATLIDAFKKAGIWEEPSSSGNRNGGGFTVGGSSGGRNGGAPRVKRPEPEYIDADYTITEQDEFGNTTVRSERRFGNVPDRAVTTNTGHYSPDSVESVKGVRYGALKDKRTLTKERRSLKKDVKVAEKNDRDKRRAMIREYAINEAKYTRPIIFLNGKPVPAEKAMVPVENKCIKRKVKEPGEEKKTRLGRKAKKTEPVKSQNAKKTWMAIDSNPVTGKGLTIETCKSREAAERKAVQMKNGHGKTTKYVQKVAYAAPNSVKPNGEFRKKGQTYYELRR